jgi:hypothetical protein
LGHPEIHYLTQSAAGGVGARGRSASRQRVGAGGFQKAKSAPVAEIVKSLT